MTTTMNLAGGIRLNGWLPIFPTLGNVFFAQSVNANAKNDPGNGTRPETPFASIDYAVGLCTANKGDVIVVGPGHVETVSAAAGLAFDVAGITVLGLGSGTSRPTINIGTLTSATVTISAANVTLRNLIFVTTLDAVVTAIAISASDAKLYDIETRDTSATQCLDFITTTAAADRLHISDWVHRGDAAAGANTAISIVGGDGIVIENFNLYGNFVTAAIENKTTACTNCTFGGGSRVNYIWTKNSADVAITLAATSTANIGPNINAMLTDNAANITEAFVSAGGRFFQPINIANLAGESSMQTNITASTDA
jgi:hypothetical protein